MEVPVPATLQRLSDALARLPGIGRRTARRLALSLLNWDPAELRTFADDLAHLHERVRPCRCCGNYTEKELCPICLSPERNREQLCVVEHASQIGVFEATGAYQGLYHVLGGRISPLSGVGPDELRIAELRKRLEEGVVKELILATSPDVEGEATAAFLAEEFRSFPIAISRIAAGLPAGMDVGYADAATLSLALGGRRRI